MRTIFKFWIIILCLFFLNGCWTEEEQETAEGKLSWKYNLKDTSQSCSEEKSEYEWLEADRLKLKPAIKINSYGSEFKEVVVKKSGKSLNVYILENFCEQNCSDSGQFQCLELEISNLPKTKYQVLIHRVEEISSGGVVEKFEVE
ncbi:MAG: hypothetical protein GF332_04405 [Candidatus Moranbacteria bacterium]|nr:hypothetical protein [Candidatus Moranbacteria bacterium]